MEEVDRKRNRDTYNTTSPLMKIYPVRWGLGAQTEVIVHCKITESKAIFYLCNVAFVILKL